ncbi:MAG: PEP-CTERM sorting domain-containing protein [Akkermansia sp.]|nr:PEP-CTERM sorting domain-containing protein [Akkermansia sp.]
MKRTLAILAMLTFTSVASSANETIWASGIDPLDTSTYYFFTKAGAYDSPMCWAISAACTIAWWQDQVEKNGALIMPKDQPRDIDVWYTMRNHWKSRGGQPARALQFWLSGDAQYSNDSQWFTDDGVAFKATGGFFPRIAGTHFDFDSDFAPPSGCMVTSVDTRGYSDTHTYQAGSHITADLLRNGYGGVLSTGSHAMAIYGVEVDEDDNIVRVYYDDNNYSSGNPVDGELPHSANVYQGTQRPRKEGDTQDRYSMGANIGYGNEISSFALIRTTGIQFTDYDVRVGKNFGDTDEFLFSHYCNLLVDGAENYELKYDLRDASRDGSPVDPIQTKYDLDGRTVLEQKTVTTGNLRLMDGMVSLVDATGDTAEFDKGGSVEGIVSFERSEKSGASAARTLAVLRDAAVGELALKTNEGTNTMDVAQDKKLAIGKLSGTGDLDKTGLGTAEVTGALTLQGAIRVHEGCFIIATGADISGAVSLAVDGGVMKGSGSFAGVTVDNGGTLIVGNSPGRQSYTGDLSVNLGEIVFGVSGWDTAADEDNVGWESGTYSNVVMNGNSLTLGGDSMIRFGVGNGALAALLGSDSGTAFSMTIATGIGNGDYFKSGVLDQLAAQTIFYVTDELGAVITNDAELNAGDSLNTRITDLKYNLVDDTQLCVTGVYWAAPPAPVPEPGTATLGLLALVGLCARRRRK